MRASHLGLFIVLLGALGFGQQDPQGSVPTPDTAAAISESLPDLTPDKDGALSQEQMRELTRVVAQNYRENYKKLRDYTYIDREVTHKLDGKGQSQVHGDENLRNYGAIRRAGRATDRKRRQTARWKRRSQRRGKDSEAGRQAQERVGGRTEKTTSGKRKGSAKGTGVCKRSGRRLRLSPGGK